MRLATLLLACGAAVSGAESATVTVDFDRPGARIPADFLGISYEKNALVDPHFTPANTTLINLHRNLGAGTLRLGGNKVELTRWEAGATATHAPRTRPPATAAARARVVRVMRPPLRGCLMDGSEPTSTVPDPFGPAKLPS